MRNEGDQMGEWVRATAVDDLPPAGGRLFTHFEKRISLFRTPGGIYATDNRCPHEGYALARGDVRDGVLTCEWHNWKFRLDDGACLFGGENVRTYPVEIRDGQIFIDVEDPPAEQIMPELFASLIEALEEVDVGRMARDTMRLTRLGTPLAAVVREGARYGAPRVEYGWNHSLATLADCMNLAGVFDGALQSLPVVQGLSVVSEAEVRRPIRPRPEPADVVGAYGSVDRALKAYPRLVEQEKAEEAEAVLRGALAAGASAGAVRRALLNAITDHFLGYGHPMIYCMKAFELLDVIGWEEADAVLGPLVPATVLATKYDRLPYMRQFLGAWRDAGADMTALAARGNSGPFDEAAVRRALLDGSPAEAFHAVYEALAQGAGVGRVIDATAGAASSRLGRFDIDLDADDTNEWGWLDVTHTLTYIDALRWAWNHSPTPEVLRGLFHAAWFVQWTQRFDAKDRHAVRPHATASPDDVLGAIRRHDPDAAVALVTGFEGDTALLNAPLAQAAAEDQHSAPIMVAHSVKTTRAAIVEAQALRGDRAPIAAAARFMASPKRERFVFNATLEAIAFVRGRAKGDQGDEG
ncbi:MAG: Rieske (2Fe-2S) protein [Actinomycetota bacterium]